RALAQCGSGRAGTAANLDCAAPGRHSKSQARENDQSSWPHRAQRSQDKGATVSRATNDATLLAASVLAGGPKRLDGRRDRLNVAPMTGAAPPGNWKPRKTRIS